MFLSVVIPTYNRLPILQKCLSALERQTVAAPITGYEIVLVDDGSTDATVSWLQQQARDQAQHRIAGGRHQQTARQGCFGQGTHLGVAVQLQPQQ